MATLIPSLSTCASRMTAGERRLVERLERKLDDDYLVWYDVPVGPKQSHPDFVVLHPRRGLLILETKHWKLETIKSASRQAWEIVPDGHLKVVINPLAQARHCAIQVVNALERDAQLIHAAGPHQGKLAFPWGHGVVFTQITRNQFEAAGLDQAIDPNYVICSDEMPENVDAEQFQQRLWNMFPHAFGGVMSLPQLDRVRWIMFPQVRVTQGALFDDGDADAELPDIMRVMDLQQEQLARSLGDGHRVIHGLQRAARGEARRGDGGKGPGRSRARSPLPQVVPAAAGRVRPADPAARPGVGHDGADGRQRDPRGRTPADSVGPVPGDLIDEGHDFQPEWLKLVTQMVDPTTNSLLLLYDDAQSIYERQRTRQFSFKSVGIQAQGRTTVLKINYRNSRQILHICRHYPVMDECAAALRQRKLPHQVRRSAGSFDPNADTIKVLTMHASKGLEFPVVALPGIGHMPEAGTSEADEARLFYVAATRATQTLYITLSGSGAFMNRFPA